MGSQCFVWYSTQAANSKESHFATYLNVRFRYFFCTDSGDIEFSILRKPDGKESEQLYLSELEVIEPAATVSCHTVPQDGLCVCNRPGMCECTYFYPYLLLTG